MKCKWRSARRKGGKTFQGYVVKGINCSMKPEVPIRIARTDLAFLSDSENFKQMENLFYIFVHRNDYQRINLPKVPRNYKKGFQQPWNPHPGFSPSLFFF